MEEGLEGDVLPKQALSNAAPSKEATTARALRAENCLKITEIPRSLYGCCSHINSKGLDQFSTKGSDEWLSK